MRLLKTKLRLKTKIPTNSKKQKPEVPEFVFVPDRADFSDIQELHANLLRKDSCGSHEVKILSALSKLVTKGISREELSAHVKRLFGPWSPPRKDERGRIIWSRQEFRELGRNLQAAITASDRTVVK